MPPSLLGEQASGTVSPCRPRPYEPRTGNGYTACPRPFQCHPDSRSSWILAVRPMPSFLSGLGGPASSILGPLANDRWGRRTNNRRQACEVKQIGRGAAAHSNQTREFRGVMSSVTVAASPASYRRGRRDRARTLSACFQTVAQSIAVISPTMRAVCYCAGVRGRRTGLSSSRFRCLSGR